jgi:hypothetical protein
MPEFLTNIVIKAQPNERSHAARLGDVIDLVGSHMKQPVAAATTANLAGDYSTLVLTASANGALTVDGLGAVVGYRLLLKDQADQTQNGIYVVTDAGDPSSPWILTRAEDFNSSPQIFTGVKVHVVKGTALADSTFVLTTDEPVLDSTPLIWSLDTGKLTLIRQTIGTVTGSAGNQTATYAFVHGWGTRMVTAEAVETTSGSYATVHVDVARPSDNSLSVTFGSPPLLGEDYAIIIRGEV